MWCFTHKQNIFMDRNILSTAVKLFTDTKMYCHKYKTFLWIYNFFWQLQIFLQTFLQIQNLFTETLWLQIQNLLKKVEVKYSKVQ